MKRSSLAVTALAVAVASVTSFACGGATATDPPGTAAPSETGAPGTGGAPSTGTAAAPSNLAVDATVTRLELAQEWLGVAADAGSCVADTATMTYDRSTRAATWRTCTGGAVVDKASVLSDADARSLEAMLASITYDPDLPCDGFDGRITEMTTYTASGASQDYVDENLNCWKSGRRRAPKVYNAFTALLGMAPP